jgi:hypothetical protein
MTPWTPAFVIISIALIFDYINGFHDAANSIATIGATRVLTPLQAVFLAAFFNFAAAFLFGTAVGEDGGQRVREPEPGNAVGDSGGPGQQYRQISVAPLPAGPNLVWVLGTAPTASAETSAF